MLRTLTTIALGAIAAATIAACASPEDGTAVEAATTTPASETGTSTAVEPAADTASVADYARIVAERHTDWDSTVAAVESDCLDPTALFRCRTGYLTLSSQAETIRLALSGAHKPGVPAYVGEPPEEVTDILADTETAAETAHAAIEAMLNTAGCDDPLADACLTESLAVDMAVSDLSGLLDAWTAY